MKSEHLSDKTISYKSDSKTKTLLFDRILGFFKEHESFSGESIAQMDGPQVAAADFLGELADDVFKFKVKYDDEAD